MADKSIAHRLWLPALVVILAGAAVVFALSQAPEPPEVSPSGERAREASPGPARGEVAPLAEAGKIDAPAAVREGGAEPAEPAPAAVKAPEGVEPPEGEGIVGILVDADGQPVSRARVGISRNLEVVARNGNQATASFRYQLGGRGRFSFGREAGITDRQGRFAIRDPGAEGSYDISFSHPDFPDHSVERVAWVPASRVDIGVVRIPSGATILGFVRDESGKPVSGARVWRSKEGGGRSGGVAAVRGASLVMGGGQIISLGGDDGEITDDEGYFEMSRVPPGTYTLHAQAEGTAEVTREGLPVNEGARAGPIQLVLSKGLELSGVVVDESGQPVAGAMVAAFRSGTNSTVQTDAQGQFQLTGLAAGKVRLTVFGGRGGMFGGIQSSQEVDAGSSGVRLVLSKGLSISGRLVDAATGSPIGNARVMITSGTADNVQRRVTMALGGAFEVNNLEPGDYRLEISAQGYRKTEDGPYTLVAGRSIDDLVIRLEPE